MLLCLSRQPVLQTMEMANVSSCLNLWIYRNTQHTCGTRRGMTINLAEWSIGQGQDIEFGPDVILISVSWAHLIGTTTQYTAGTISDDQSEAVLVPSWPIRGRPRNLDTSVGGARLSWLLFPAESSPGIVRMGADMGGSPVPGPLIVNCELHHRDGNRSGPGHSQLSHDTNKLKITVCKG